ncbi:MAG: hypothetical protein J6X33_02285 [Clostridiales bacterium]|nr:hypothetical protein [Clostridiales bacterium]
MENVEMKMLENISENTGIYVVCNDKSLLENINGLLSRSGMLCVRDNSGKVSYLVDGRHDRSAAMTTVSDLMTDHFLGLGDSRDVYYEMCAKSVFMSAGFDMSHTGTAVLYIAVREAVTSGHRSYGSAKNLYMDFARRLHMSFDQVSRDVRYSINASCLKNYRTLTVISQMVISISDEMTRDQGLVG